MFLFARERAYLLLLAFYCAGIVAGDAWPVPHPLLSELGWLIWLCFGALVAILFLQHGKPGGIALAAAALLLCVAGWISASLQLEQVTRSPLRQLINSYEAEDTWRGVPVALSGRVSSMPKLLRGHLRFSLDVELVEHEGALQGSSGRCYVFVNCKDLAAAQVPQLFYNSRVSLRGFVREVEPARNFGEFDYRRFLLQRGMLHSVYVREPAALALEDEAPAGLWRGMSQLREKLTSSLARGLPGERGSLAVSVVYGDKISGLPPEIEQRFQRAGLMHILVASGTQVSLLVALLGLFFWRVNDGSTLRGALVNSLQFVITIAVVLAYATVTGFETSIVRALVMGTLALLGKLLLRDVDGMSALAQSALVVLLVNPLEIFGASFQLSFGAAFGLIYFHGVFAQRLGQQFWQPAPREATLAAKALSLLRRSLASAAIGTTGAQIMVLPLLLHQFQQFSLWGFVSNLLAIPLAFLLLLSGGVYSLGLSQVPLLGPALATAASSIAGALDWTARVFAGLPGSDIATPVPPAWWVLAYFALLIMIGETLKLRRAPEAQPLWLARLAIPALGLCLASAWLSWILVPRPELAMLNLRGCEAYLLRDTRGRTMLFLRAEGLDREFNAESVSSALRWRGINTLHALVWLDEAGPPASAEDLLSRLVRSPLATYSAADPLPGDSPCRWLAADATGTGPVPPIGAEVNLGGSSHWLLWSSMWPAGVLQESIKVQAPGTVLLKARTWLSLDDEQRDALLDLPGRVAVASRFERHARTAHTGKLEMYGTEARLKVNAGKLRTEQYEYRGP